MSLAEDSEFVSRSQQLIGPPTLGTLWRWSRTLPGAGFARNRMVLLTLRREVRGSAGRLMFQARERLEISPEKLGVSEIPRFYG